MTPSSFQVMDGVPTDYTQKPGAASGATVSSSQLLEVVEADSTKQTKFSAFTDFCRCATVMLVCSSTVSDAAAFARVSDSLV